MYQKKRKKQKKRKEKFKTIQERYVHVEKKTRTECMSIRRSDQKERGKKKERIGKSSILDLTSVVRNAWASRCIEITILRRVAWPSPPLRALQSPSTSSRFLFSLFLFLSSSPLSFLLSRSLVLSFFLALIHLSVSSTNFFRF